MCGSTGGMYVCMLTEYADGSRVRGMSGMGYKYDLFSQDRRG